MLKRLLLLTVISITTLAANAVTFTYDNVDVANRTCRLAGISSHTELPVTLNLPSTCYTQGVVCEVTAIAPDALNDLPGVNTITIPATITKIGDQQPSIMSSDLRNFLNCPDLSRFYVAGASETFASTSNGLLTNKRGDNLLRCPTKVAVNNGVLELPKELIYFPTYCFAGVTTANVVQFEELAYISGESGLNLMPNLSSVRLLQNAQAYYYTRDNILYSDKGELICFPPRKMLSTYKIPDGTPAISPYAFANALYLGQVTIPSSVTEIGKGAFMNSSISTLTVPPTVTKMGSDICRGCRQLASLNFQNYLVHLPKRTAMDCPKLTTVTYAKLPEQILSSAFKNCISLEQHPLTAAVIYNDSTFYNTGFTKVVFDNAEVPDDITWTGTYIFGACRNLTSIDLSAVGTTNEDFWVGAYFAVDCPKLTEVIFPAKTYFKQPGWQSGPSYTFGSDCKINKAVLHAFSRQGSLPVFSWYSSSTVRPNMYMKLNGTPDTAHAQTYNLCTGYDNTVVKPIYYYERYAPLDKYVDSKASYYVPGGCLSNFQAAIDAGCYVEEMYRFKGFTDSDGFFAVELKEIYPEMIELVSLKVNNTEIPLRSYGTISSGIPVQYVKEIEMNYKAHGELLTTSYPVDKFLSVDGITVDDIDAEPEYFDLFGRRVETPAAGNLYIVRRGNSVTKQLVH